MSEKLPPSGKAINKWLADSEYVRAIKTEIVIMRAIRVAERREAHREYIEDQRRLGVKITVIKD